jgi:hypothetical protein
MGSNNQVIDDQMASSLELLKTLLDVSTWQEAVDYATVLLVDGEMSARGSSPTTVMGDRCNE